MFSLYSFLISVNQMLQMNVHVTLLKHTLCLCVVYQALLCFVIHKNPSRLQISQDIAILS